jgi:preprotein translocase subunit SecE
MKKVKPKKKQGMIETETKSLDRLEGQGKEGEVLAATKNKEKGSLKKTGLKEKEGPEEGLASKWAGKVPWIGLVRDFLREVRIELKKVTWPSRKETIAATSMVIILSVLVAFFLGFLDIGLSKAVGIILKR